MSTDQCKASGKGGARSPAAAAAEEPILNCPRCDSSNTKFRYYNNHSLSQPRYFCRTCLRYWTQGGALRSIPVGGGRRRIKETDSSSSSKISGESRTSGGYSGVDHSLWVMSSNISSASSANPSINSNPRPSTPLPNLGSVNCMGTLSTVSQTQLWRLHQPKVVMIPKEEAEGAECTKLPSFFFYDNCCIKISGENKTKK